MKLYENLVVLSDSYEKHHSRLHITTLSSFLPLYDNIIDIYIIYIYFMYIYLLLLPSLFPFLYGVAVSDEPFPSISILCFCLINSLLTQVSPHTVLPSLSWSPSSSSSLDLHPHSMSTNVVLISSQQVSIPSQPPLLHFLWYFHHLSRLISATSIFFSSVFLKLAVSVPYIIAVLTTVLWNFPFNLSGTLLSWQPDTVLAYKNYHILLRSQW